MTTNSLPSVWMAPRNISKVSRSLYPGSCPLLPEFCSTTFVSPTRQMMASAFHPRTRPGSALYSVPSYTRRSGLSETRTNSPMYGSYCCVHQLYPSSVALSNSNLYTYRRALKCRMWCVCTTVTSLPSLCRCSLFHIPIPVS